MPTAAPPDPAAKPPGRLLSIDAIRGFDMVWIVGGDAFVRACAARAGWPPAGFVEEQLEHAAWEGFHFIDLIFPLFLFLVGVVLPFSLGTLRERGASGRAIAGRVARRAVLLFALGLVYNGALRLDPGQFRLAGVLQRIAACYAFAALATLRLGPRGLAALAAALLLGYWALLALVPAPGHRAGDYSMEGSLPGYVDRLLLPGRLYYGQGDNEGLLATIPAVATALIGVLAGHWLRSVAGPWPKVLGLAAAGAGCLVGGAAWARVMPVIKILWTSPYVLLAAGWSLLLLAIFYAVIDVLHLRRWAFFFVVIGANAITIYLGAEIVDFGHVADFFLGGLAARAGRSGPVILTAGVLAAEWLVLLHLYRNRIFLRV